MEDDLETTIRENAKAPAKAATDGTSVEQHRLADQIALDRYLASKQAAKSKNLGIGFSRLIPPGTA